jgi:predicted alpha/beta-hydrolase family hydrolase
MLFLQGTRDDFAELALLESVCARLEQRATLHVVEGADHSFRVPKRAGRSDADVLAELTKAVDEWSRAILA